MFLLLKREEILDRFYFANDNLLLGAKLRFVDIDMTHIYESLTLLRATVVSRRLQLTIVCLPQDVSYILLSALGAQQLVSFYNFRYQRRFVRRREKIKEHEVKHVSRNPFKLQKKFWNHWWLIKKIINKYWLYSVNYYAVRNRIFKFFVINNEMNWYMISAQVNWKRWTQAISRYKFGI